MVKRSVPTHATQERSLPSVLAITHDSLFLRHLRLEMPLMNMKKQGLIREYAVIHPRLQWPPSGTEFDVVWFQRVMDWPFVSRIASLVGNQYLYDIDDLLIRMPPYCRVPVEVPEDVLSIIENCKVLVVTSSRSARIVEKHTRMDLMDKAVVCPNGFEFPQGLRQANPPQGLVWTSSDFAALINSKNDVIRAVASFSERHELPVYCVGYLDGEIKAQIPNKVDLGLVSYWHHKALLASFALMIGLGPLETDADADTIDFIEAKSDLKMVEFGGFGHTGVYSRALPYTDTDLKSGVVVENSFNGWTEGLEFVFREGWKKAPAEQEETVRRRNMDRLAKECWYPAMLKIRLSVPVKSNDIRAVAGSLAPPGAGVLVKSAEFLLSFGATRWLRDRTPELALKLARRMFFGTWTTR